MLRGLGLNIAAIDQVFKTSSIARTNSNAHRHTMTTRQKGGLVIGCAVVLELTNDIQFSKTISSTVSRFISSSALLQSCSVF